MMMASYKLLQKTTGILCKMINQDDLPIFGFHPTPQPLGSFDLD
jgi:hypothetical protein